MKKILFILTVTAIFAACNSNPKTTSDTASSVTIVDTVSANHNAFTDKAHEVQLDGVSDTIVSGNGETYVKVNPKDAQPSIVESAPATKERATVRHTTHTRKETSSGAATSTTKSDTSSTVSNGTSGTSGTNGTETTTPETKKKGWSKAAKGAVIGAGTGAAAGAIISKKKGKGAIIGGIIGGAGGYILGRSKDKKDGRY